MTATAEKRSVYQLGLDWQEIQSRLTESDGEITDEIEAKLAALTDGEADRVDAYRVVVSRFEAQAEMLGKEIEGLSAKQATALRAAKRLKDRLLGYLEARGVEKLDGNIWVAAKTKNGGLRALTVHASVDRLPPELVVFTTAPDTARIRSMADADGRVTIDGELIAELAPAGHHLRFR